MVAAVLPAIVSFAQDKAEMAVSIQNVREINSPAVDYSPTYYGNGLVFVSSRNRGGFVNPVTGETYYELFHAPFGANGQLARPRLFSIEINSALHEGPVTFDKQENTMYFTRSNQESGEGKADETGTVRLKIYRATRGIYDWEGVEALPFNSDAYTCMHPSLSADGSKLFFASNMPGGYGGTDIYMVIRIKNQWSAPINLGPEINTPKQEGFPFFHENGTLFFSSNGHKGLGGMDVFSIDLSGSRWGLLTNLGEPINSASHDFGFIMDDSGKKGYFSSNRKGGMGKDDIYAFRAPRGLPGMKGPEVLTVRINVHDGIPAQPLAGAAVFLFERSPDGLIMNDSAYTVELAPDGADRTLRMNLRTRNTLGKPDAITDKSGNAILQMRPNTDFTILVAREGFATVEIPFTPEAIAPGVPLEVPMARSTCIPLSGQVLSADKNQPVGNATVRIVRLDSDKEQIVVADNRGMYAYCLEMGSNFVLVAEKEGYQPQKTPLSLKSGSLPPAFNINFSLPGPAAPTAATGNVSSKMPFAEGVVIVLDNIYYDFNQAVIRKGQAKDLEALAALMKQYPEMEIELGAHTDSRGSADYNLELSRQRAEAAKLFLVSKGIGADRVTTKGYGESVPRNGCVDGVNCTESEHQFNRRTEVKVLKMDGNPDTKN
jgi:outer membrane protein OmpA-like peptidoglycan-associated protein